MTENSGFASFFGGDSKTDILSTVSGKVEIFDFSNYGRYVYLGNLLIQFSDISSFPTLTGGTEFTFEFPKAYTSTPYCVMVSAAKYEAENSFEFVTLVSFDTKGFTFNIIGDTGNISFVAIGPR
jgi:hypothetical protein